MPMTARTPTDGKPYYCTSCKLGYAEYLACEDGPCELESDASAEVRCLLIQCAKADQP